MSRLRIGRLVIYTNKIERGDNGSDQPWRGFCWGSDWPRMKLHRQGAALCLDLSWLCYFASIYWNDE